MRIAGLEPARGQASTDFKSVVSTIPPHPRRNRYLFTTRDAEMKRKFLLLTIIFCTGCSVFEGRLREAACDGNLWEPYYFVNFEYGHVRMSDAGRNEVGKVAYKAKYAHADVCIVGYESYRGTSSNAAYEAYHRALSVADVFLEVGVLPEKIYIDMKPESGLPAMVSADRATQEGRQVEVRIRKGSF